MKTLTPFKPWSAFKSDLLSWPTEDLWNRFFARSEKFLEEWNPDVDLIEKPDKYLIKVEVPGMTADDINLTLEGREITIKGERSKEEVSEEDLFRVRERSYGSFLRSFSLPMAIDTDKIEADVKDGVLMVKVPKAEAVKPTKIKVKGH